jgi:hypothetical protein
MEEHNEFREIGKKLPYQVTEDFLAQISEKTLRKAKLREQSKGKRIILWRSVAAASLVAAVVLIGFLIINQPLETTSTVQNDQLETEQPVKNEPAPQVQPAVEKVPAILPEKITPDDTDSEKLADVLTDLSDEELLQLAAMIKTDPFISETIQ